MKRNIFIISDGTGITADSLANSLLTQFNDIEFEKQTLPYLDSLDKAEALISRINICYEETGNKPLIFLTLINSRIGEYIKTQAKAAVFDLFGTFISPLEKELKTKSSYTVGLTHGVANIESYQHRIEAVDYTLAHDDGIKIRGYEDADIILIGVSRCGKTPSCLYMALQFGILAANYPFTDDDLSDLRLPDVLRPYKSKLFGLSIDPQRLKEIRTERRPNSQYSSADQCRIEIAEVEAMYQREKIPFINTTNFSIEEIATKIMSIAGLTRKI